MSYRLARPIVWPSKGHEGHTHTHIIDKLICAHPAHRILFTHNMSFAFSGKASSQTLNKFNLHTDLCMGSAKWVSISVIPWWCPHGTPCTCPDTIARALPRATHIRTRVLLSCSATVSRLDERCVTRAFSIVPCGLVLCHLDVCLAPLLVSLFY